MCGVMWACSDLNCASPPRQVGARVTKGWDSSEGVSSGEWGTRGSVECVQAAGELPRSCTKHAATPTGRPRCTRQQGGRALCGAHRFPAVASQPRERKAFSKSGGGSRAEGGAALMHTLPAARPSVRAIACAMWALGARRRRSNPKCVPVARTRARSSNFRSGRQARTPRRRRRRAGAGAEASNAAPLMSAP